MIFLVEMQTFETLKNHIPEYAIEAWCLGTFMMSACVFGVLLYNPVSPLFGIPPVIRDVMMGLAMGATAILIICSPLGQQSGAHFNPAVTLAFYRLGKINGTDAAAYVAAQFAGGAAGVLVAWLLLGNLLADASVNFVATQPGPSGAGTAFVAEAAISFVMMTMVLITSNSRTLSRFTPYFAGLLVALFITFEAPLSGMSMNPARTFASAAIGGNWAAIWIYFTAPPMAMLAAAEIFVRRRGIRAVLCAKLHHSNRARCIFNCNFEGETIYD